MRLLSGWFVMWWVLATAAAAAAAGSDDREVRRTALESRVTARWDALIRQDFAAAYALNSPAYREIYSLEAFKGRFGGKTAWRRIDVVDVAFNDDDAATVGINLHFVYYPPQSERALDMTTYTQESWVRVGDQWWYLVRE